MGKLWMPVSNFKKIHEDDKSATLQHPDGHQVVLSKNILSPAMRQQLAGLQMNGPPGKPQQRMARGGPVSNYDEGGPISVSTSPEQIMQRSPGLQQLAQQGGGGAGMPQQQQQGPQNASIQASPQQAPPNPNMSGMKGLFGGQSAMGLENQGMQNQLSAGRSAMNAQQAGAGQRMQAADTAGRNIQQDMDRFTNGFMAPDGRQVMGNTARTQEADAVKSDVLSGNINAQHFMEQGALPKVITALGLIGAMSNSKGAGEQLLNYVNQQQDRDMQAQVQNRNTKLSVLDANIKLMGNYADGFKMTQAQNLSAYQALVEKSMAMTDNGMAKAQYQNLLGTMQQKKADMIRQWTVQDVLSGGQQQAQGPTGGQTAGQSPQNMPTDSMGNPLSGGGVPLGGATSMWNQYNPVKMPGTQNSMFAKSKEQAGEANGAVREYKDLDDALRNVHEATGGFKPSGMLPGSTEHIKRQGAIDQLNSVVTRLAGSGRLKPQQIEALQNMTKHVTTNPLPGFLGENQQEEALRAMAGQNTGQLHNTLEQDLNNYQRPLKPDGEAVGG